MARLNEFPVVCHFFVYEGLSFRVEDEIRRNDSSPPHCIGLAFVLVLCRMDCFFYRAARDRNERFMVGGFALGYVLGIVGGFLPVSAQSDLKFGSIAAFWPRSRVL